ncbi:MAG TPA: ABC transporter substrate-binding protein [Methylocystis sp.]|nr:ABC transporter substrate-binding protein [Methylocystis sp.]
MRLRALAILLAAFAFPSCPSSAFAADALRLAVQATGTTAWELAVVSALRLDEQAGLKLETTELASPEAGKIALVSGGADIIVSDWLWVARERAGGARLALHPASTAIGAVLTKDATVKSVGDLAGKKLGVAGGALDKSWLLLKAYALQQGVDLEKAATIVYGAPPLLAAKLQQGELDAALEFWNFAVDLEARGFRAAIDLRDVERALGATGKPVVTGYVFDEGFAAAHKDALARFFAMMTRAKSLIATDDAAWRAAAARIPARDPATLALYRKRYVEGDPSGSLEEQEADAARLYEALAKLGGEQLVGPGKSLEPKTFYKGAP